MKRQLLRAPAIVGFAMVLWLLGRPAITGVCAEAGEDQEPRTPDCVYVPTPHDVVEKMLELADIKKTDVVFDLGCGDGRIVVQAAKKRGCKGVGFEISPPRLKEARENVKSNNVGHLVEIRNEDLFQVDFSEATVLPMYLLPKMLAELKPKFEKLKPGTRIISHDYAIEGIKEDKLVTVVSKETSVEHYLYVYIAPLKKDTESDEPDDSDESDDSDK